MEDIYIIAEIGSNWRKFDSKEKNLNLAYDQIDVAKICGADAVKFQFFTNLELYGKPSKYEPYSLNFETVTKLYEHCKKRKIDFMCSAFSIRGFQKLNQLVNIHKIASPEACHKPLVEAVQGMGNPIIVSNGCLTYEEQKALVSSEAWGADDVLMECVSNYPASPLDYDFYPICKLSQKYRILWGLSDHTKTVYAAQQAKGLGAKYFEKHVDLVKTSYQKTPDSCVSIDRYDFEKYVKMLRTDKGDRYDKLKSSSKKLYGRKENGYRPINA